jgi:hypothetical protein
MTRPSTTQHERFVAAGRGALAWAVLFVFATSGFCQFGDAPQLTTDLSGDIRVDEAAGETRAHLERVDAFLKDDQWDEAVETLRRVMENRGDKIVPWEATGQAPSIGPSRYTTVRQYGHRQLARWAREFPEALAVYRRRVDPLAERWVRQGIEQRDEALLLRVLDQLFASSHGDDALHALGEIYLEQGKHALARDCWERISPLLRAPTDLQPPLRSAPGGPVWLALWGVDLDPQWSAIERQLAELRQEPNWLAYPDTDLRLADVRARLALTSILEGSLDRARIELEILRRLHPDATGRMGGRVVAYVELLESLIEQAAGWPAAVADENWRTFAGDATRNRVAARGVDIAGGPIWRVRMGPPGRVAPAIPKQFDFGTTRLAEDAGRLLSYHPVIDDGLLLVNDQSQIRAVRLTSGKPWPDGTDGVLYRSARAPSTYAVRSPRRVGVPRFTMTVHRRKLFARMGSPVTSHPSDEATAPAEVGYLVGLDLAAQGRLLPGFPIEVEGKNSRWAFEGAPLADAAHLYVAMRRSDVRPQAHVACYRLSTGQLKWRKLICAAETPGHGQLEEITHNLLTIDGDTIYYNTNLGAVAALRKHNGGVQWITGYRRAKRLSWERGAAHFYRDLNPCVCYRSWVFAAPADTEHVFALDAGSGQILWQTDPDEGTHGSHSVHLLGVVDGSLIVSGDRLWWIDIHTGRVLAQFPDGGSSRPATGGPEPRGSGRGILAGQSVYWATRDRIYVFDQQIVSPGNPRMTRQPIELDLDDSSRQFSGGSLLMNDGIMVVVTDDELIGFSQTGEVPEETQRGPR